MAVTPQEFGAVGDGITDDTAALLAALQYPDVEIPPGTYLVAATLPVAGRVRGAGPTSILQAAEFETFAQANAKPAMILFENPGSLSRVKLVGSTPAAADQYPTITSGRDENGIVVTDGAYGVTITDVQIEAVGKIALCCWSNTARDVRISGVTVTNCGLGFESEKWTTAPGQMGNVTIEASTFAANVALNASGIEGLVARACAFTSSASQEGNTVGISDALGVTDATFTGCTFAWTGTVANGGRALSCYGYRRSNPGTPGVTDYATPGFHARFESCRFSNSTPTAAVKLASCDMVEFVGCTMSHQVMAIVQDGTANATRLAVESCTLSSVGTSTVADQYGLRTQVCTAIRGSRFLAAGAGAFRGVAAIGLVPCVTVADCDFGDAYLCVNVAGIRRPTVTGCSGSGLIHNASPAITDRFTAYGNAGDNHGNVVTR